MRKKIKIYHFTNIYIEMQYEIHKCVGRVVLAFEILIVASHKRLFLMRKSFRNEINISFERNITKSNILLRR